MSTKMKALAAAIAALAFAQGASAISIDFSTPNISLSGGAVTETISISGLTAAGQVVSGYNIYVDYNPAVLAAGTITPTPLLNDGGSFFSDASTPGVINLQDYSVGPDSALLGQNLDSVVLAQIVFTPTPGTGFSALTFGGSGAYGPMQVTGLTDPRCNNPTVAAVPGECPFPVLLNFGPAGVPEPATFGLLAIGLFGLGFARRRAVR